MLKYDGYSIVLQEVPDEISLAFNITGCPWRCEGCHSKNLWEDTGRVLDDDIYNIIDEHRDEISCVLFMGGDHERGEILSLIDRLRFLYPGLKIAMYTGDDNPPKSIWDAVDYLKVGHYVEELGGLDKKTTNQRMYKISHIHKDITERFWKDV